MLFCDVFVPVLLSFVCLIVGDFPVWQGRCGNLKSQFQGPHEVIQSEHDVSGSQNKATALTTSTVPTLQHHYPRQVTVTECLLWSMCCFLFHVASFNLCIHYVNVSAICILQVRK